MMTPIVKRPTTSHREELSVGVDTDAVELAMPLLQLARGRTQFNARTSPEAGVYRAA